MFEKKRAILWVIGGVLLLCVMLSGISALSNRNLPTAPESSDQLDALDKVRLEETLHLQRELGDKVWPCFAEAEIPLLLWTDASSFLVNYPQQPAGWKVVTGDTFQDELYYRQPTRQTSNFAVEVDGLWVASLASKWETDAFLIETFQGFFPPPIKQIFPYKLLIQPSEVQMTGMLHEAFHVFQIWNAEERLEAAEASYQFEEAYWQVDEDMRTDWQEEIDLLAKAVNAATPEEMKTFTIQFLDSRANRRDSFALAPDLIEFERSLEWEEGLAKYVELEFWQAAYHSADYEPLAGMQADSDFKAYATFKQRWSQEISTMKRQAKTDGVSRFYYTGMVQAYLLDELMPGWKERILSEDIFLEDLLQEAVGR